MIVVGVAGKRDVGIDEILQTSIDNCGSWVKMEFHHTIMYFGIC